MHKEFNSEKYHVKWPAKCEEINAERYGMIFCRNCNGSGKYFYADRGVSGCDSCGGFGLITIERYCIYDDRGYPFV